MLGQLFRSIGLLPSDKVIEVDKSKLVASYVGQTAPLVNQWCDKAMGGILFIDEAYSITGGKDGDTDSFGQDAIDALLKRMEDDRGKFVVIAAGYKNEMKHFLDANPGLQSRFTHFIDLEDYTPAELFSIFTSIIKKNNLNLTQEASDVARDAVEEKYRNRTKNFANGREVRNMYDEMVRRRSSRLAKMSREERTKNALSVILPEDIAYEKKKALTVDEILSELDAMIGLDSVKKAVRELANKIEMQKEREEKGAGEAKRMGIHIVFTGNPGTGKTTVARKLGVLFRAMDLLPRSDVIEKDKSGMVGQYVGSTPKLVNQACDDAMGAILFVDEAYTLAGEEGMKDSFGQEAIDTLMKRMEDDRGKFVVIAAGYKKEMERFLAANPGMRSRFTDFIHLDDYNPDELFRIYELTLKNENYFLDEEAKAKVKDAIAEIYNNRGDDFANARTMRNLADETTRRQSSRISELTKDERTTEVLTTITADDIKYEKQKTVSVKEILSELDSMIGLTSVKQAVRELAQTVQMDIEKAAEGLGSNMPVIHIVFTGNPGTGKTTVARKLGKLLQAMKLLPSAKVVEVDRSKLVASYVGQTGPLVNKACDDAMGGILFVDEAYSLVSGGGNDFGKEAIDTLLKRMEDDRGKFVVIAAGYENEMQGFIEANPGLKSRFTHFIHLEDYKSDELAAIYISMATQQGYRLTPEAEDGIKEFAVTVYDNRGKDFANGRTMRNYLDETIRRQASRIAELSKAARSRDVLITITEEDIPK
jgi:SpoVK/Ycf46/Vps4 family AAA+-type ATPase